jgi:uncharacterized protein
MNLTRVDAPLRLAGCAPVPATALSAVAGTSFKPEHFDAIAAEPSPGRWFEVHAENYMVSGGPRLRMLENLRRDHAISLHGVCMSIGGPQRLDAAHLERFQRLVNRYEPALVSEHLAWSTHGSTYFNDLLPVPYHRSCLNHVCDHVDQVQEFLGRSILLENPSTYLAFVTSTMSEPEFLEAIVRRTGCGLLLDLNNVWVSATNHGLSAREYLAALPLSSVGEIHLAGHSEQADDEGETLLIDSHDRAVAEPVWHLYVEVIRRWGPSPTLIEWDSQIPSWTALQAEAERAQRILDGSRLESVSHVG